MKSSFQTKTVYRFCDTCQHYLRVLNRYDVSSCAKSHEKCFHGSDLWEFSCLKFFEYKTTKRIQKC